VLTLPSKRLFLWALGMMSALIAVGVWLVPVVAVRHLKRQDQADQTWHSSSPSLGYAGPVIEVVPSIEIHAPRTVRVTETKDITITISKSWLGHSDLFPGAPGAIVSDQPPKVDNRVEQSYTIGLMVVDDAGVVCAEPKKKDFGDSPLTLESKSWYCTMHPKQASDYEILISGLPSVAAAGDSFIVSDASPVQSLDLLPTAGEKADPNRKIYKRFPDGTVTLSVIALTAQGIPAREWAWLEAVGAMIGVLGTILGLPFLKFKLEKQPDSSPSRTDEKDTPEQKTPHKDLSKRNRDKLR